MSDDALTLPKRPALAKRILGPILLLRESLVGTIGLGLVIFWIAVALLAPVLAPFPPNANLAALQTPGSPFLASPTKLIDGVPAKDICQAIEGDSTQVDCGTFWLGTDLNGRDVLSRIIYGAQTVLIFAPMATFFAYLVGVPMGLWAGYRGGRVDAIFSFISNVILSFPVLVLYVLIISTIPRSSANIVAAVVFASAPGIFRIVRGLTMDLRAREYVAAAETRGEPLWYILLLEILPNARGPLIVDAMLRLGYVIITIGTLAFLGLGLPPPDPDWGRMISEGRTLISFMPHVALFPCLAISSLVLGFNLMADGLREVSLRD
ncbi:MAG: ABC transporter permease [Rhodospirillales bacterium]